MKALSVSLIPVPSPDERKITESLAATFTLTFMAVATPEDVYERALPLPTTHEESSLARRGHGQLVT